MRGGIAAADALLTANDQRDLRMTAEDVARLGDLVDQLIHGDQREIHVHQLYDRAHTGACRAQTRADEAGFADGGIERALLTKFLGQIAGAAENGTDGFYVFTHDEDLGITAHFGSDGIAHRHCVGLNAHASSPPS